MVITESFRFCDQSSEEQPFHFRINACPHIQAATKPKARPSPSTFVKSDVKAADAAEKEVQR
eukprot:5246160-Amphidinium_carterae.1